LSSLRHHLAPCYSTIGRPSVDPEPMIRMLIVGHCFGIRSERRLSEERHPNLAYRWFCGLGLSNPVPAHSTFSKNRHVRDADAMRRVCETVARRCIGEGRLQGFDRLDTSPKPDFQQNWCIAFVGLAVRTDGFPPNRI
jgi:transposase